MYKEGKYPLLLLELHNVCTDIAVNQKECLRVCHDISLTVEKGRTLGIVGESGCGKSTLMRTIMQIHPLSEGKILFKGKDQTNLKKEEVRNQWKHIQMVFQDPSTALNPKMKIKDIICEPIENFQSLSKKEKERKAEELLQLVELPISFKDRYPRDMSGGQRQRIGLARALALEPDLIICDEATSALDVSVQEKICHLLCRLQKERGIAYLFICHDLSLVSLISHDIAVMYLGTIVERLPAEKLYKESCHPYTQALMNAVFTPLRAEGERIQPLQGEVPSLRQIPSGCPFQSRCPYVEEKCRIEKPTLRTIDLRHQVACHRVKDYMDED